MRSKLQRSASFSWDTTSSVNGSHTLQAKAYDAADNVGASASVIVTVQNAVPDTTAPTVQITSPTGGTKVSRSTKVSISSSDNAGVIRVDLYIDGKLVLTSTNPSPTYNWNTGKIALGQHTLQAFAYDAAGNKGSSAIITVTK